MKIIAILKKIKHKLRKYQFNYYKTIIANFKLFPFKQAIHFPLVIYNRVELKLSNSKITLNVPPKFALIRWGLNQDLFTPSNTASMLLMINGEIIINGYIRISPGCVFRIINGKLNLGKYNSLGGGSKLLCNNKIYIDDYSRFGFGSILCDTNFHYINHNGIIVNCNGEIKIGKSIFVGNNSSIVKGAIIPDYSIISSKSYVNKDFSEFQNGALIAGAPAKILKEGYRRISSPKLEEKIKTYFDSHKEDKQYIISEEDIDNPEDMNIYYL